MRYVVTGANGFAGRHLVAALAAAGAEVIPLTRKDVDLLDRNATAARIAAAKPDGVFHLAAPHTSVGQSWKAPEQTIGENLESTLSVLAAARTLEPRPRVLFVSSAEVLGDAGPGPLAEDAPPAVTSPYALSKLFGEQACALYFEQFAVPTLVVRAFNHIGPGQRPDFVLADFARQIAAIEKTADDSKDARGDIRVGNLDAERDFTDVRDVVRAYVLIMRNGTPGRTYHVGSRNVLSIRQALDGLLAHSPATINVVVDESRVRPNDIARLESDPGELRSPGWEPEVDVTQTLEDILNEARKEPQ